MFELKKESVKIKDASGTESTYEIGPLTGEYLEDFYTLIDRLSALNNETKGKGESDASDVLKLLGSDASRKLHRLVYASLAPAYPEVAKEGKKLDQFVSQNLMAFLPAVMKINVPSA
jgi:hypothetical protein